MGCTVGRGQERIITAPTPRNAAGTCEIVINSGLFVKENKLPFGEVYTLGRPLGSGSFAEVYECVHKESETLRAVKIYKKHLHKVQFGSMTDLSREVDIMMGLDHPNIAKVFEFFNDERQLYIVMELCSGGELFTRLCVRGKLNENKAAVVAKQVLSAISYMHSMGVMHRDLKPENVLLESRDIDANIKIVDFGISTYFTANELISCKVGTPLYMAPEMFTNSCNELCDEWALGVMLYLMLSGNPPFEGNRANDVIKKITMMKYTTDRGIWKRLSPEAVDLVHKLLAPASTRIPANEALQHPWIISFANPDAIPSPELQDALSNIKHFHKTTKLVDATLTFITAQRLSFKDVKHLRDIFRKFDVDGDGRISAEEMIKGMHSSGVSPMSDQDAKSLLEQLDSAGTGFVDYSSFLKASVNRRTLLSKSHLLEAFKLFDADGNGKISADEIRNTLQMHDLVDDSIDEMVRKADANGDGEIDLHEFENLCLGRELDSNLYIR